MATRYERDTSNFDRALGFFDAVYGFALTLLVTTIDVSGEQHWQSLGSLLAEDGAQLLSFLISFAVIVAFWRQNHARIGEFTALDSRTISANIVVIGCVVFIPFTTEAMGDADLQELPLPTAVYALNVGVAMLANIVMYQVALARGLVDNDDLPRARRARLVSALVQPVVMFASIPVTYIGVSLWGDSTAGKLFWLLLVVTGPFSERIAERVARRARVEAGLTESGGPSAQ